MTDLPFRSIVLYKHGVGYFERRGDVQGDSVRLSFPRAAMDDVLKSLIVLDLGAGQVLSVDFETPEDRPTLLAKGSIHLSDEHSMRDLLRDLRGRQVRCSVASSDDDEDEDEDAEAHTLTGVLIGVDFEQVDSLKRALVALYLPEQKQVVQFALRRLRAIDLLDSAAAADLSYFLRASQNEEDRRSATVHLSAGEHDLLVGYIAPAPAWRVSYRMLVETAEDGSSSVLLQGWGLFDNQLEEDLEQVQLTLVAGMPVSFRYRLYEPHTPERPLIEDEERTVNAPVLYEAAPKRAARMANRAYAAMEAPDADMVMSAPPSPAFSMGGMAESVQAAATGDERGALFAYHVSHPVSVARGQSAMVPILSSQLACRRELLYNGTKLPQHPVASVRLDNETGLTLERGPVTVLEESTYAGEAVIPFTSVGSEVIVPFAVELGINVVEHRTSERRIAGIRLRDDYLLIEEYEIQYTTYKLTSTLPRNADVIVEHNRRANYTLLEMAEPLEQGATYARWQVPCQANSLTEFEVREQRLNQRREAVGGLQGNQMQQYFKQGLMDKATFGRVQEVLTLYRQIEQLRQQIKQIEKERGEIHKHQQQLQGNLTPLGREGNEGALRERYVAELGRLEDQLAQLATTQKQHEAQIATIEQRIRTELSKG